MSRRLLALLGACVLSAAAAAVPAQAADQPYSFRLLAKAQPDECFAGIGQPYPPGPPCAEGTPKVNQAYVWGLTKVGADVWFGTGANTHCLTSGATLDVLQPTVNDNYVCEYGESQIAENDPDIPPEIGDQRPPQVWLYNARTRRAVDKSAEISRRSPQDAERLRTTVGLRAAGTLQDVVLLGGPALGDSLNLFAFHARTHRFIGSVNLPAYGNIRTFLVADRALYLGVGIGRNGGAGGAVLRWTGSARAPFRFQTVADLPVQAADLALHDGRIAATSWPADQPTSQAMLAGVWISPPLADGAPGLRPEDAAGWTQVWNARQYETDRVISATYGGGGIASYGGYLYWGTMHVPLKATKVHQTLYPQSGDEAIALQVKNTQRAISIWRGKDLGGPGQRIELLYGESTLPAYDPATGTWADVPTGWTPKYGTSGFGYQFNNYTWRMAVTDGKLFVGTMDWSYLIQDIAGQVTGGGSDAVARVTRATMDSPTIPIDPDQYGGDLYMFPAAEAPAQAITKTGAGNYLNYGIRNMIVDRDGLYLGMANPMNLRTDPDDDVPEGGWELIRLTRNR
ncbi:hypothetical protein [Mangrovihabitans endophyticus]|uniref:Uncharacterized protein n=1 Tax=Mangrovihabitans endophyticus TaxID=1751298 RepID=A0A8J3BYJ7_9ACTN|nr:hypothetical protein [Mangrovihabitans endophyticus]GGK83921.1 hypothetical protein GCM10012284_17580 [Mangrovihabitans endophyticus]